MALAANQPELKFRFSKEGEDDLVLKVNMESGKWDVYLKGSLVGSFEYKRKELKKGIEFKLADGTILIIRYIRRGAIQFWEPSLNGKIAYKTIKSEYRYIWISWLIVAFIEPFTMILSNLNDDSMAPYVILAFCIGIFFFIMAIIRWKPIAIIFAVCWCLSLIIGWLSSLGGYGTPPIPETIGTIIFRSFWVDAKFIWNVLKQVNEYEQGKRLVF